MTRATNFSSSTGNLSIRSANTAKLARDLKQNTLGLAKANLENTNLSRIAAEEKSTKVTLEREAAALRLRQQESEIKEASLLQRLRAMEEKMAGIAYNQSANEVTPKTLAGNPGTDPLKENDGP